MPIIFGDHALERARQRGATREEIIKILEEGLEVPVREGRKSREKVFEYGKEWLGISYPEKKLWLFMLRKEMG